MAIRQWTHLVASLVPLVGCAEGKVGSQPPSAASLGSMTIQPTGGAPLHARYYVSPAGSDRNPGTAASPFGTLQRAADVVRPGDSVIVRPGLYTGGERIVSLENGGTEGAWITFRSERKWGAVLDGRDGASLEAWYFGPGVGYVSVEGFEIRNLQSHGFDTYGGGVHDLSIVGNHVHHIGRNCTDTSNGRTGASLGASTRRVIFDGNVWHNIGRYAPGERGCFPKTEYYQNHDHGIYVADADEITIRNNLFYDFARGWPIHRYFSRGVPVHGLLIVNNTFVGANPYRAGQIILASQTNELRIENNIFYSPQTAALLFEDLRFHDASVRYNMIFQGAIKEGRPSGVRFEHNWERVDPRLTGTGDFRLRSDSPAIDVGLPLVEVTHDADGVARPRGAGYDLGAYER
jgi:parallel beta helix pectate lyase-like protein/pectate lyase-like protein